MLEFFQNNPVLLVILALAAFIGIVWFMVPAAIKRGVKLQGIIDGLNTTLEVGDIAVDALGEILPGNQTLKTIDKIIEWAQKGAETAEQLYKAHQLAAEERKEAARKFVLDMLKYADIEATEQLKKIVDDCIEAAVYTLPKTNQ